jgi:hypothetical protein
VAAFDAEFVHVGAEGFGDPQPGAGRQRDQCVLGAGPSPAATGSAPTSLRSRPKGVRLIVQPWPAHVLDRVPIQAADRAKPAGDPRPRPTVSFHVPAEGLDIRPTGSEQVQPVQLTPGHYRRRSSEYASRVKPL